MAHAPQPGFAQRRDALDLLPAIWHRRYILCASIPVHLLERHERGALCHQRRIPLWARRMYSCRVVRDHTQHGEGGEMVETRQEIDVIQTDKAAAPIGPYSQAIRAAGLIFVAGEKGIDPATNQIVAGGIAAETRQTLENIRNILESAGSSMARVVATSVYMTDLQHFGEMNQVYAEYFTHNPPGRTTVGVAALPVGAQVEITVTALA
jgi:2-iminobutanoate/2-iminopropanoate deaminase